MKRISRWTQYLMTHLLVMPPHHEVSYVEGRCVIRNHQCSKHAPICYHLMHFLMGMLKVSRSEDGVLTCRNPNLVNCHGNWRKFSFFSFPLTMYVMWLSTMWLCESGLYLNPCQLYTLQVRISNMECSYSGIPLRTLAWLLPHWLTH